MLSVAILSSAILLRTAAAQVSPEVPLRVLNGSLCVKAQVGDHKMWFALDTADEVSSIDPLVARSLKSTFTKQFASPDEPVDDPKYAADVSFGAAQLKSQFFTGRRVPGIGQTGDGMAEPVVGILGHNVLRQLCIGIDFRTCKLWAWSLPADATLRATVFGRGVGTTTLCRLRGTIPRLDWIAGGLKGEAILDLGSYTSFLSLSDARRLKAKIKVGGKWRVSRIVNKQEHDLAVLSEVRIGGTAWSWPPMLLASVEDDFPSGVGWTVLVPLGQVLLDFREGAVYSPTAPKRFGFLNASLSLYNTTASSTTLDLPSGKIKLADIRSLFDIPIRKASVFQQDSFWTPSGVGAPAMLRFYEPWKSKVVFKWGKQSVTRYLMPFWAPKTKS